MVVNLSVNISIVSRVAYHRRAGHLSWTDSITNDYNMTFITEIDHIT